MRQFDIEFIQNGLVRNLRNTIGYRLGKDENGLPYVIKERRDGFKPDAPFLLVEFIDSTQDNWLIHSDVNDRGNINYYTQHRCNFLVTCIGKNSKSIMSEIKQRMEFESVRIELKQETDGGVLNSTQDIVDSSKFIMTSHEEREQLLMVIDVTCVIEDDRGGNGFIEAVHGDGEIKDSIDDPDPILIKLDIHENDKG